MTAFNLEVIASLPDAEGSYFLSVSSYDSIRCQLTRSKPKLYRKEDREAALMCGIRASVYRQ